MEVFFYYLVHFHTLEMKSKLDRRIQSRCHILFFPLYAYCFSYKIASFQLPLNAGVCACFSVLIVAWKVYKKKLPYTLNSSSVMNTAIKWWRELCTIKWLGNLSKWTWNVGNSLVPLGKHLENRSLPKT